MAESVMIEVPEVRQRVSYDCGPSVARSILWYYDRPVVAIDRMLGVTRSAGTHPSRMAWVFVAAGLRVNVQKDMPTKTLREWIAHKIPVVCCVSIGGSGHWVIVRSVRRGVVHLMDPDCGYSEVKLSEFEKMWHDKTSDDVKVDRFGIAVYKS